MPGSEVQPPECREPGLERLREVRVLPDHRERVDALPPLRALPRIREDLYDLRGSRPYDRNRILDAVEAQLRWEPNVETRNRKILANLVTPFESILPPWQLRVGEHRVFYDVVEGERVVIVRAVRRKPPHRRTEEIL